MSLYKRYGQHSRTISIAAADVFMVRHNKYRTTKNNTVMEKWLLIDGQRELTAP